MAPRSPAAEQTVTTMQSVIDDFETLPRDAQRLTLDMLERDFKREATAPARRAMKRKRRNGGNGKAAEATE